MVQKKVTVVAIIIEKFLRFAQSYPMQDVEAHFFLFITKSLIKILTNAESLSKSLEKIVEHFEKE